MSSFACIRMNGTSSHQAARQHAHHLALEIIIGKENLLHSLRTRANRETDHSEARSRRNERKLKPEESQHDLTRYPTKSPRSLQSSPKSALLPSWHPSDKTATADNHSLAAENVAMD